MTDAAIAVRTNPVHAYFSVLARGRTWLNVLFLALAFPLGLAWFVFLAVGLSLGLGLSITLVGIPLLIGVVLAWRVLVSLERWLAVGLLGVAVTPAPVLTPAAQPGAWARLKAILGDSLTWRGLLYLVLRFPLGILAFTATVVVLAIVGAMLAAPFLYTLETMTVGPWIVDTFPEALACLVAGVVLAPLGLRVLDALAWVFGQLARVLLSGRGAAVVQPPQAEVGACGIPIGASGVIA